MENVLPPFCPGRPGVVARARDHEQKHEEGDSYYADFFNFGDTDSQSDKEECVQEDILLAARRRRTKHAVTRIRDAPRLLANADKFLEPRPSRTQTRISDERTEATGPVVIESREVRERQAIVHSNAEHSPLFDAFKQHKKNLLHHRLRTLQDSEQGKQNLCSETRQMAPQKLKQQNPPIQIINASKEATFEVFKVYNRGGDRKGLTSKELKPGTEYFRDDDVNNKCDGSLLTLILSPRVFYQGTVRHWAERVGDHVCSSQDTDVVIIEFRNHLKNRTVDISWIDYGGNLVLRQSMKPGQTYTERTFATHPWIITVNSKKRHKKELLMVLRDSSKTKDSLMSVMWNTVTSQQSLSLMPVKKKDKRTVFPDASICIY